MSRVRMTSQQKLGLCMHSLASRLEVQVTGSIRKSGLPSTRRLAISKPLASQELTMRPLAQTAQLLSPDQVGQSGLVSDTC